MCGPGTPRDKVFIFIVIGALGDENDSEKCWGHLFKSAKCASGRTVNFSGEAGMKLSQQKLDRHVGHSCREGWSRVGMCGD